MVWLLLVSVVAWTLTTELRRASRRATPTRAEAPRFGRERTPEDLRGERAVLEVIR